MRSRLFHWLLTAVVSLGVSLPAEAQTNLVVDDYDPLIEGTVTAITGTAGRYFVGGHFDKAGGITRKRIALIHPDHSVDATFAPAATGTSAYQSNPINIYPQPDGTVVVTGALMNYLESKDMSRLNADGSRDNAFYGTSNLYYTEASCVSGSKFFHAARVFTRSGSSTSYFTQIHRMTYDSGFNGRNLDPDFTPVSVEGTVHCMLPLPDGRIVLGGLFTYVGKIPRTNLAIINADGTLNSFNMQAGNGAVFSLAAGVKDGVPVIYFGGSFTYVTLGSTSSSAARLFYFRPQEPTFMDTTFIPNPDNNVRSLLILPDQTLVLAGDFLNVGTAPRMRMAMIRQNGTLMPDAGHSFNNTVRVLVYDPVDGGRIVAGGLFSEVSRVPRRGFARVLPHAGIIPSLPSPETGVVRAMAQQADGKLWIGGDFASSPSLPRGHLTRLAGDGSLDATVDVAPNDAVNAVACLPDGRTYIGGTFTQLGGTEAGHLARLNANGAVDATFDLHADGAVLAISARTDGSCYVAGSFTHLGGAARTGIARLRADGSLDSGFAPVLNGAVKCVLVQTDGKVLVGGDFATIDSTSQPWLARLNADGTLDTGFTPQLDGPVLCLSRLADGDVLAGGLFASYLCKLAADGSWRTAFTASPDGPVHVLCTLADGSTLIGGQFTKVSGQTSQGLASVTSNDGRVLNGPAMPWGASTVPFVQTLLPLGLDGKLLVGGQFTLPLSTSKSTLALLTSSGATGPTTSPLFSHDTPLTKVIWGRTGGVQELSDVTFDLSVNNGTTWTALGTGELMANGGWAVPASMSELPVNKSFVLRARGVSSSSGSSSFLTQSVTWTLSTPILYEQPRSWSYNAGESVILRASTNSPGATYQWFKNGVAIPGATQYALEFTTSLSRAESGTYHAVVTNVYGSTTSNSAVITVLLLGPEIMDQPQNTTVIGSSYATFSVSARNGPLSYQWYKDDVAIPGATLSYLQITDTMSILDTPKYKVVVSNLVGSVTSKTATLTVTRPLPVITTQPENVTVKAGNRFSLSVTAAYAQTSNNYRWYRNGQPIQGSNSSTWSVYYAEASMAGTYHVVVTNIFGSVTSQEVQLTVLSPPTVTVTEIPADNTVITGTAWGMKSTVSGGGPYEYQWQYCETNSPYSNWWSNIEGAVSENLEMAASPPVRPGYYRVSVKNSLGTGVSSHIRIRALVPVTINRQPVSQDLNADEELAVSADVMIWETDLYTRGWPNVQLQWFKDGVELPPGTNLMEFRRLKALESDSGEYQLRITNAAGVVESQTVTITVSPNTPPTILTPPHPRLLLTGQPLGLSIEASGSHPMTATWRRNGARLPNGHGVVKNNLSTFNRNATLADSGQYSVMLVNDHGTVFSSPAQVVTVDSASRRFTLPVRSTVTFPAVSTASGVQYQWLHEGIEITDTATVSGSATASLRIIGLTVDDAGVYTCRVTRGENHLISGSSTLAVLGAAPVITTESLPQSDLRLSYSANLEATESATLFKVTGLPPGLSLNAATGEISGEPTKTGTFKIQATASNVFGKSATRLLTMVVEALPAELTGTYFGLFDYDAACAGGQISVTVTNQGSVSGKLLLNTQTLPLKGTFQRSHYKGGVLNLENLPHKDLGPVNLEVVLDWVAQANGGDSTCSASVDHYSGLLTATLFKPTWSRTKRPLVYEGYHTFSFIHTPGEGIPSGYSYGSATVSSAGVVAFAGKLADNTAFTASTPLSDTGDTGFFCVNDGGRNFVNAATLAFHSPDPEEGEEAPGMPRSNRLEGNVHWLKIVAVRNSTNYPDGFEMDMELQGSRYLAPNTAGTGPLVMNLEAKEDNLALTFEGRITGLDFLDTYMTGTLKAGNVARFLSIPEDAIQSLRVAIIPKTGIFTVSATFKSFIYDDFYGELRFKRTLTGSGIIFSNHDDLSGIGKGFFLMRAVGYPFDPPSSLPILSAPMTLE